MKKSNLTSLVEKYSLNGNIESVVWKTTNKNTTVELAHPDKTLIGTVTLKDSDIEDSELGIFDTTKLTQMLSVLESDFMLNIKKIENKPFLIELKDSKFSMNFVPADVDVIPKGASLKQLPPFETEITIDDSFVDSFSKATKALNEGITAFICNDNSVDVVVGYSSATNVNTVKFNIDPVRTETNTSRFKTDYLKSVLLCNRGIPGKLEIASKAASKVIVCPVIS